MNTREEHLLDLAEMEEVDMTDLVRYAEKEQRDEDEQALEDGLPLNPRLAIWESVRLDVYYILRNQFGPMLSLRTFLHALQSKPIVEQLTLLDSDRERSECILSIYQTIAHDALMTVLAKQGLLASIERHGQSGIMDILSMLQHYRKKLSARHNVIHRAAA